MTKEELRELASVGMVGKLRDIESTLAGYHKMFPTLFINDAAPQFVKPELRNGHGSWPKVKASKKKKDTHGLSYAGNKLRQRRQSRAVLDYVTDHEPIGFDALVEGTKIGGRAITPLIKHKYLKHTNKGLVRTKKTFTVGDEPRV